MTTSNFETQTTMTKEELAIALKVITEFKEFESTAEWFAAPFIAWAKLEELEAMLQRMTKRRS